MKVCDHYSHKLDGIIWEGVPWTTTVKFVARVLVKHAETIRTRTIHGVESIIVLCSAGLVAEN
jgi:hypothetical protein